VAEALHTAAHAANLIRTPPRGARPVLAITPDAATAIRAILDASPLDDAAGLRISPASAQDGQSGLELALAEGPDVTDEVLADQGVQIFLAPPLAEHLDDRLLHARVEEGKIAFELLPQ